MINWLKKLLYIKCCEHKWNVIEKIGVYAIDWGITSEYPEYSKYVLQCEKCGDIKVTKV